MPLDFSKYSRKKDALRSVVVLSLHKESQKSLDGSVEEGWKSELGTYVKKSLADAVKAVDAVVDLASLDVRRDLDTLVKRAKAGYANAVQIESVLMNTVSSEHMVHTAHKHVHLVHSDVDAAVQTMERALQKMPEKRRDKIEHAMMRRDLLYRLYDKDLGQLSERVNRELRERARRGKCFLSETFIGPDAVDEIVGAIDHVLAGSLRRVNRAFSQNEALRDRMPRLSVRSIFGSFPHGVLEVDNREVDVVSKKDRLNVCVDFAVIGRRCKRFEKYQSISLHTVTSLVDVLNAIASRGGRTLRQIRALSREEVQQRTKRDVQWGDVRFSEIGFYRKAIDPKEFFDTHLACSLSLVFADTKEEVPAKAESGSPLVLKKSPKDDALHSTWTSFDKVPYPAVISCRVDALSSQHGGREFALKVKGVAERDGVRSELVCFSRPFTCLARKPQDLIESRG